LEEKKEEKPKAEEWAISMAALLEQD
jgi:hypothetical protein